MTASTVVDPRVDAYGVHARSGALADYVEVRALHGLATTRAKLEDIAKDQSWGRKERRTILLAGESDDDEDIAGWSEMAFSSLDARLDILGEAYPFEYISGSLVYAGPAEPADDPYVALLALTVAHAWGLAAENKPTAVLERTVERVLRGRHMQAADLGTGNREGQKFQDNLKARGAEVGLTPRDPRPCSANAKDEGVDTLGTMIWADRRLGQWIFIGQVTCGSSLTWRKKLLEPQPGRWVDYLQDVLLPQPFLAVPHHIDHRAWENLMADKHGLLLDRLRICMHMDLPTPEERSFVAALLAATVV